MKSEKNVMRHAFLLTPTKWTLEGLYYDARGDAFQTGGTITISIEEDHCNMYSRTWVKKASPVWSESVYSFSMPGGRALSVPWSSEGEALGPFSGNFLFTSDVILSVFISEDGIVLGTESLHRLAPLRYQIAGACYIGDKRFSAWECVMTGTEEEPTPTQKEA